MKLRTIAVALSALATTLWSDAGSAATYKLKFYQVDDDMKAFITNLSFTDELVLERGFGPDYPYVDITSFVRDGPNTLDLMLVNGPQGWTYGYDFTIDDVSYASGACGIFNTYGCNADAYGEGLVWTTNIQFDGDVGDFVSEIPEPAIWLQMIVGFGIIGMGLRKAILNGPIAITVAER